MAIGETVRLLAALELDNRKFLSGASGALAATGKLDKGLSRAGRGLGKLGGGLGKAGLIAGGAVAAGLALATKSAGDFESQMNIINTVAKKTGDAFSGDLGLIGERIRAMSRDTGTSLSDLTGAYYDLVSAGIKASDAQNVLNAANTLAIGGLSTTGEAVDLLTTAINSYGGDASKATLYANQFAEAIAAGKVTAAEIAASFAQVGPIAAQFGVGINEIAAALGVMTAQGTPAAEAITQMRAAIVALQKPNSAMAAFQKKVGINFEKFAKKNGLAAAYDLIAKKAEKLGIPMAKLTGRIEGANFAAQVTGKNFANYNAELEKVNHSSEDGGEAARQMAERTKGFNYELGRLHSNITDAAISIGEGMVPALGRAADKLAGFLNDPEFRKRLKEIGKEIGEALDKIDWSKLLSAAESLAKAFKPALDIVLKIAEKIAELPPGVIGGAGALIITDRVTGGAISGGIGGIVGGLGESIAKSLAASIPVFGNAFVQPVRVVNFPGGLGGGGGTSIPGGAAGVGALGAVGLTAATMTGLAAGIGAAVVAGFVTSGIIDEKGGLGPALKPITDKGLTLGSNVTIRDPEITGARFLGGKGSSLIINPDTSGGSGGQPVDVRNPGEIMADNIAAVDAAKVAQVQAIRDTGSTTGINIRGTTGAVQTAQGAITAAIYANRPIVNTNVDVSVTSSGVERATTTSTRYGEQNGSAGRGITNDRGKG